MKTPDQERNQIQDLDQHQKQQETGSGDVDRREFVGGSIGAAVLGTAAIAGAAEANAQSAEASGKFSTPDWRTLEPGTKDTDLYTEESGFDPGESDLTWWKGRNVSGVTIGLVQFRANLPMMPGNMGNATTFDFPMLYREMNAENVFDVMANPLAHWR